MLERNDFVEISEKGKERGLKFPNNVKQARVVLVNNPLGLITVELFSKYGNRRTSIFAREFLDKV